MFENVRFVFMMGYDKEVQDKVKLEAEIYKDIVQEDFIDSYKNLTYKGIMAMKWISEFCPHARYILKVDDDIITNLIMLLRHIKSLLKSYMPQRNKLSCLGKIYSSFIIVFKSSMKKIVRVFQN